MFKYTLVLKGPTPFDVSGFVMREDLLAPPAARAVPRLDESLPIVQAFRELVGQAHPLGQISIVQRWELGRVPREQGQFHLVAVDADVDHGHSNRNALFSVTNTRTGLVACYFAATLPAQCRTLAIPQEKLRF